MRVDCKSRFTFDGFFGEVDVVVLGSVDHFDVDALVGEVERLFGNDRGGYDDERVGKCVVPDALCVGVCVGGQIELDGRGERSEKKHEQQRCR